MTIEHTIEIDGREVVFEVGANFTPGSRGCSGGCRRGHSRPDGCVPDEGGECDITRVSMSFASAPYVNIPAIMWPILFGPNFEREIAEKAEKQYEESKP